MLYRVFISRFSVRSVIALWIAWGLCGIAIAQPHITDVQIVSDPLQGNTYGLGEDIEVRVFFNENVVVDVSGGTPRVRLKFFHNG
ncbi:MAG: hypothetical protein J4F29_05960, partial [Candidatus Latescibacteria bacterium]|nr:hypothetical protein [Candidatus Latescibacterota bacterium]